MIERFKYMNRQSDDTEVLTRLLVNAKIVSDGSKIQKLPGYYTVTTVTDISGGGTLAFGYVIKYKNPKDSTFSTVKYMCLYDDKLYYFAGTNWVEVTWRGATSPDFGTDINFWYERNKLFISGGNGKDSAVLQYIDREKDTDENGYFNNAEEFDGVWFGPADIPQYTLSYISFVQTLIAYMYDSDNSASIEDFGLDPKRSHYFTAIFVTEDGQVSRPSVDGYDKFANVMDTDTFVANIRQVFSADSMDRRVRAIDCFIGFREDVVTNAFNYPNVWGEQDKAIVHTNTQEEFKATDWRYFRRININDNVILFHGKMAAIANNKMGYYAEHVVDDKDDMTLTEWPDAILSNGDYYLQYRAWGSTSSYQEVAITLNYVTTVSGSGKVYSVFGVSGTPFTSGAKYECKLIAKMKHNGSGIAASAIIYMKTNTNMGGKKVTINGTDLTEGSEWNVGANKLLTAQSLRDAINNAALNVTASLIGRDASVNMQFIYLVYDTAGTAGNAVTLSTDVASVDDLEVSNSTFEGGVDGDCYSITLPWRYGWDLTAGALEKGDPIETVQPYSLIGEYFPSYKFAVGQNRRTWYLDCTTDKRHRNMLLDSEVDMPSVIPNRNAILLNTFPGEEARGEAAIKNAILACFEKTSHYISMTGEPVQYDAEEGRFEWGCLSDYALINFDENALIPWIDGIRLFTSELSIITNEIEDFYKELIKSEYSGNANSYSDIFGGYCGKQGIAVWTFPNSTMTVNSIAVKLLGYDTRVGGFFVIESGKDFASFFTGYGGELYGVASDGIYELFADSPTESNRFIWISGQNSGRMNLYRLRLNYNGTLTLKGYVDRLSTASLDTTLSAKTSMGKSPLLFANLIGEEIQLRVDSVSSTDDQELGEIESVARKMVSL